MPITAPAASTRMKGSTVKICGVQINFGKWKSASAATEPAPKKAPAVLTRRGPRDTGSVPALANRSKTGATELSSGQVAPRVALPRSMRLSINPMAFEKLAGPWDTAPAGQDGDARTSPDSRLAVPVKKNRQSARSSGLMSLHLIQVTVDASSDKACPREAQVTIKTEILIEHEVTQPDEEDVMRPKHNYGIGVREGELNLGTAHTMLTRVWSDGPTATGKLRKDRHPEKSLTATRPGHDVARPAATLSKKPLSKATEGAPPDRMPADGGPAPLQRRVRQEVANLLDPGSTAEDRLGAFNTWAQLHTSFVLDKMDEVRQPDPMRAKKDELSGRNQVVAVLQGDPQVKVSLAHQRIRSFVTGMRFNEQVREGSLSSTPSPRLKEALYQLNTWNDRHLGKLRELEHELSQGLLSKLDGSVRSPEEIGDLIKAIDQGITVMRMLKAATDEVPDRSVFPG